MAFPARRTPAVVLVAGRFNRISARRAGVLSFDCLLYPHQTSPVPLHSSQHDFGVRPSPEPLQAGQIVIGCFGSRLMARLSLQRLAIRGDGGHACGVLRPRQPPPPTLATAPPSRATCSRSGTRAASRAVTYGSAVLCLPFIQ